jgi:DNA-binding MarR family transcriptional regulator
MDTLPDTEFIILENIYGSSENEIPLRQRDLAHIAGASLGMTNAILKRLAQKGWITVKKINSRNIQYAVTLDGINEILRRSYRYVKRTIKNIVYYRDTLEALVQKALSLHKRSVVLVGASDLDFIIEHACSHRGLNFVKTENVGETMDDTALVIFAENIRETPGYKNAFYLSRVLLDMPVIPGASRMVP